MKKVRQIHLIHLFESLGLLEKPEQLDHVPLFFEREIWLKFKICCYFQGIEPQDALRNYIKSASPDQVVEYARKYVGGKK